MVFKMGVRKLGNLLNIPEEMLGESVIGAVYEVQIKTKGISNPQQIANLISSELPKKVSSTIKYIEIGSDYIILQIEGSPFPWALLLGFLPQLLLLAGVVVMFISVWSVISAIPSWAWALLAVGGGLVLFGPTIGKALIPKPPPPVYVR